MKKYLLLTTIYIVSSCAFAQTNKSSLFLKNDINDIVLMYYGGKNRKNWTVEEISHFVTHTFKDGHSDWLFPGFLFLEFRNNDKDVAFIPSVAKNAATKSDWEWLLNRYFAKNQGLHALDTSIENAKQKLGEPPFIHKVILGLPSPLKNQTDWGTINTKLKFNKASDRIAAVKWFIEKIITRFYNESFSNIELEGFYWIDEDMNNSSEVLLPISKYIKSEGLKLYWIPYFGANGRNQWKSFGFDYAYLQPNYYLNQSLNKSRLDDALLLAKKLNLGLEMEFDERYFSQPNTFGKRFVEYIDFFENNDVFKSCPLTYYCGNAAFMQLSKSKIKSDIYLIDRLSTFICNRNKDNNFNIDRKPAQSNNIMTSPQNNKHDSKSLNWTDPEYWHF